MTELKPVSSLMASCLGAVILTVSSLSSAAEPSPVLDAMDVFDLEWASDPQVAPDGKSVIYVRRSFDVMSDAAKATLWQVAADGTDHRPLKAPLALTTCRGVLCLAQLPTVQPPKRSVCASTRMVEWASITQT